MFASRRFLPIFITQFLTAFNDNLLKNALVALITYKLADLYQANPSALVTIASAVFIIPFFLFSATAGKFADSMPKAKLATIVKALEIAIIVIASVGFIYNYLYLLIGVLFLMGLHSTFFGPVKYGILPDLLDSNELVKGNGYTGAGTFIAILLGMIAGGLLILEENGAYLVSAIGIIIAIIGYGASLYVPRIPPNLHSESKADKASINFLKDTFSLLKKVFSNRKLLKIALAISWFWFVGATLLAQIPGFTKLILLANQEVVTLFYTTFSIAVALGALSCNRLLKGEVSTRLAKFGAAGIGLFIIGLYLVVEWMSPAVSTSAATSGDVSDLIGAAEFLASGYGILSIACFFGISFCGGFYAIPLYAVLQRLAEEKSRSQTVAASNILNSFIMVISAVFCTISLGFKLSEVEIFLLTGVLSLVVSYLCRKGITDISNAN
jgi:acyl-[acyl-carrier-protein]-phospholipid O-acyltransferase/long-chain-fatty-acid--[acyl-carrier-protein] ligase